MVVNFVIFSFGNIENKFNKFYFVRYKTYKRFHLFLFQFGPFRVLLVFAVQ